MKNNNDQGTVSWWVEPIAAAETDYNSAPDLKLKFSLFDKPAGSNNWVGNVIFQRFLKKWIFNL